MCVYIYKYICIFVYLCFKHVSVYVLNILFHNQHFSFNILYLPLLKD